VRTYALFQKMEISKMVAAIRILVLVVPDESL
jgi:hypothetical protein